MKAFDLKAFAGDRFKISMDESAEIQGQSSGDRKWLTQIQGSQGHVYVQSKTTLGAFVRTSGKRNKLLALKGSRLLCDGDKEHSVEFQPRDLDAVAGILGLRKRRRLSEEQKQAAAKRLAAYRYSQQPG